MSNKKQAQDQQYGQHPKSKQGQPPSPLGNAMNNGQIIFLISLKVVILRRHLLICNMVIILKLELNKDYGFKGKVHLWM